MLFPTEKVSPKQMNSSRLVIISCSTCNDKFTILSQPLKLVKISEKFPEELYVLFPTEKVSPKQMTSSRLVMISCSTCNDKFTILSQPLKLVKMSEKFPEVLYVLLPTEKVSPKQMNSSRLVMISCSTCSDKFTILSHPLKLFKISEKFPEAL